MRHSYAILLYAMSSPFVDTHLVIQMSSPHFHSEREMSFRTGTTFVALSLQASAKVRNCRKHPFVPKVI